MSLLDKHIEIESFTEAMEPSEIQAYSLGVMAAIQALLQELQTSKEEICEHMFKLQELGALTKKKKLRLEAQLDMLDVYSKRYSDHLDKLTKDYLV